ncbi:MAG: hypothetical protein Q7V57_14225 [Actinomycetota bacterium]|nr:hypothetical protein [Actinomycetota bacterium]
MTDRPDSLRGGRPFEPAIDDDLVRPRAARQHAAQHGTDGMEPQLVEVAADGIGDDEGDVSAQGFIDSVREIISRTGDKLGEELQEHVQEKINDGIDAAMDAVFGEDGSDGNGNAEGGEEAGSGDEGSGDEGGGDGGGGSESRSMRPQDRPGQIKLGDVKGESTADRIAADGEMSVGTQTPGSIDEPAEAHAYEQGGINADDQWIGIVAEDEWEAPKLAAPELSLDADPLDTDI